jgi:hypothetical protein
MENFALSWFLTAPGDHASRVRWMVATTAMPSAWNSIHRWRSIYPRRYYKQKEFAFLGTRKSTRGSTMSF